MNLRCISSDSENLNLSTPKKHDGICNTPEKSGKLDDSISDMFKKMTLKDRNSRKLSELNSFDFQNVLEQRKDFMTSSPIRSGTVLQVPKFRMKEAHSSAKGNDKILSQNQDRKGKENCLEEPEEIVQVNATETPEEPLARNQTVFQKNKRHPPVSNENLKINNEKDGKIDSIDSEQKSNIHRSVSLYPNSKCNSKVTVPKPFSFESKDKAMLENRQKKVDDDILELKKMASAFRANPMPISSPRLPEKTIFKATNPVPFDFESVKRANIHLEKCLVKSFMENSSLSISNNMILNKSKDLSYLSKSPFLPKPSMKPLTIPETPQFKLKTRTEQRRDFEEHRREIEKKVEEVKEELAKEQLEKEKQEIKVLRQQQVIKARPIRHFKKTEIVHSTTVTVPHTPKFSDRFKK